MRSSCLICSPTPFPTCCTHLAEAPSDGHNQYLGSGAQISQSQRYKLHLPAALFSPNVLRAEKAQRMYFQTIILFICCQVSEPLEHTCFLFLSSFAQPQHVKTDMCAVGVDIEGKKKIK